MKTFHIKIIAVLSMVISHTELFFLPNNDFMFLIGRLAFPLFAWLIANGAHHTKNINQYILRLFVFACISQIPFILANREVYPTYSQLNILFTFSLGLLAIKFLGKVDNRFLRALIILGACIAAQLMRTDYGLFGVCSVLIFYFFHHSKPKIVIGQTLLFVIYTFHYIYLIHAYNMQEDFHFIRFVPVGLLALAFIHYYDGKEGPKLKYLFYIFYPAHYVVFYLLLRFL